MPTEKKTASYLYYFDGSVPWWRGILLPDDQVRDDAVEQALVPFGATWDTEWLGWYVVGGSSPITVEPFYEKCCTLYEVRDDPRLITTILAEIKQRSKRKQ